MKRNDAPIFFLRLELLRYSQSETMAKCVYMAEMKVVDVFGYHGRIK